MESPFSSGVECVTVTGNLFLMPGVNEVTALHIAAVGVDALMEGNQADMGIFQLLDEGSKSPVIALDIPAVLIL